MKTCSKCRQTKNESEFYKRKRSKDNLHPWCKGCCRQNARESATKRRQKVSHRRSHLKLKYDFTEDEYNALWELQQGRCVICSNLPVEGEKLMVDHDHNSGEVRGLLCRKCNTGLGFFDDDIKRLLTAVDYIKSGGTYATLKAS